MCSEARPYPAVCLSPQIPVAIDEESGDEICGCPERHIPQTVYDFTKQMQYEIKFGCSIDYYKRNNKYLEMFAEYETRLSEYRNQDPPQSKGKDGNKVRL